MTEYKLINRRKGAQRNRAVRKAKATTSKKQTIINILRVMREEYERETGTRY